MLNRRHFTRWSHLGWVTTLALLSCRADGEDTAAAYPHVYGAWAAAQTAAMQVQHIPADRFATAASMRDSTVTVIFSAQAADAVSRDRGGRFYIWEKRADRIAVVEPTGQIRRTVENLSSIAEGLRHTYHVVGNNDTLFVLTLEPAPVVYLLSPGGLDARRVVLPWQREGGAANVTDIHPTTAGAVVSQRFLMHECRGARRICIDTVRMMTLDIGGATTRDFMSFPYGAAYALEGGYRYHPAHAPYTQYTVDSSGNVYTHGGDVYDIAVWSAEGYPMRRILGDTVRLPVTAEARQEHLRSEMSEFRQAFPGRTDDAWLRAREREVPLLPTAEYAAVIGRMLVSLDGTLLVERHAAFRSPELTKWDAIDKTGQLLGQAVIPAEMRPFSVDWPYVFVQFTEGGAVHIGRLDLRQ